MHELYSYNRKTARIDKNGEEITIKYMLHITTY